MSMNRYANAGPIMAGLAAMSELLDAGPVSNVEGGLVSATFALSPDELLRMIENVADQLSEVAAQMVDIRKRLDSIEVQQRTLFKNQEAVTNLVVKDVRPRLDALESEQIAWGKSWFGIEPLPDNYRDDWKARWREQLQAQQSATMKISYGNPRA